MMSLFVVSACNLSCGECIMMNQMKNYSGYQMSLEELNKFLTYAEKSNYKFHYRYTGGEPLYWKKLEEGTKLLRNSKTCKSILLMTNGMAYDKLNDKIVGMIDYIRISQYDYNKNAIKYLVKRYPNKVKIVDRQEFLPLPNEPIHDAVPVECGNFEHLFFKGKVYACPHSASLAIKHNLTHIRTGTEINENFCDDLNEIRHNHEEICKFCISNKKVALHVEKIKNVSKNHENLIQIELNG